MQMFMLILSSKMEKHQTDWTFYLEIVHEHFEIHPNVKQQHLHLAQSCRSKHFQNIHNPGSYFDCYDC